MSVTRRQFIRTASGALAFATSTAALARAGLAAAKPIKVANISDATGGLNVYALKQIKATAMAFDEINKAGGLLGRPVEVMFYDAQSNNQFYSQYATQALLRDGAEVIIGGITSSAREVMRPIIHRFKSFLVYPALYEGGVCDMRFMCPGLVPSQQVKPLVDYIVGKKGLKKGYIVAADYNYGHITAKWMQKFIREAGGKDVAVEFFPLDTTNFSASIARIQDAGPDVVWSALVGEAHESFYRQYESTIGKAHIPIASTTYGLGRENVVLSPAENDGIVIATSFIDSLDRPKAKEFIAKFKKFSGEDDYVGEYAEYGYRAAYLWANSVKKAGTTDGLKLGKAMGGVTFDGPGSLYTIDGQTHHVKMDVHIVKGNRKGGFDMIKSYDQVAPTGEREVCNLYKNPNDDTQYEPKL